MKRLFATRVLMSGLALTSCSDSKSVAADYLSKANSSASGDSSGAVGDTTPAVDDSTPAPAASPAPAAASTGSPSTVPTPAVASAPAPTAAPVTAPAPATAPVPAADPAMALTYANLNTKIFSVSCLGCHSASANMGGVSLDTYAKVKAASAKIKVTTLDMKTMPTSGPLSTALQSLLSKWIAAGAPEK
ncbi:MAG: hypothetical protein H7249_05010 [Chitinophagaceae bacterium]|nr:hypothetical protein [Oligoflexus sp.]